jgi:hypothetical protein
VTAVAAPVAARPWFHGPADGFRLSAADLAAATSLCDTMQSLRAGRAAYLGANGLDPRVYLPAHLWDQHFVGANFAAVAQKDAFTLDHLRFLCHNFTGFSLLTMAPCADQPEQPAVPRDVDARVRESVDRAQAIAASFVGCIAGLPPARVVTAPRLFGEAGRDVGGTLVNPDTWSCQQRVNGLHASGVLDLLRARGAGRGRARVLEIGAGYGALAHALQTMAGPLDYVVVDLPESMLYSSIWLSTALPALPGTVASPGVVLSPRGPGFTFVANHLLAEFAPQLGGFDLVVNTMSLSEMAPVQVDLYARHAAAWIGRDGVFF